MCWESHASNKFLMWRYCVVMLSKGISNSTIQKWLKMISQQKIYISSWLINQWWKLETLEENFNVFRQSIECSYSKVFRWQFFEKHDLHLEGRKNSYNSTQQRSIEFQPLVALNLKHRDGQLTKISYTNISEERTDRTTHHTHDNIEETREKNGDSF